VLAATHGPPASRKAGGSYHRFSQIIRHSLRDGFTAYTSSPWGPGFLAPIIALTSSAQLSLSVGRPGPHDFAVRSSAVRPHEQIVRELPRPSHPVSRLVTIGRNALFAEQGQCGSNT